MPSRQNDLRSQRERFSQRLRKLILFAMLGTLMFASKLVMEALPNIQMGSIDPFVYVRFYYWTICGL